MGDRGRSPQPTALRRCLKLWPSPQGTPLGSRRRNQDRPWLRFSRHLLSPCLGFLDNVDRESRPRGAWVQGARCGRNAGFQACALGGAGQSPSSRHKAEGQSHQLLTDRSCTGQQRPGDPLKGPQQRPTGQVGSSSHPLTKPPQGQTLFPGPGAARGRTPECGVSLPAPSVTNSPIKRHDESLCFAARM